MGSLFHWVARCKWCMWGSLEQRGLHPLHHWRPAVVTGRWHIPTSRGLLGLTPLPLSVLTLQQVSHLESDECNCYSAIQTVQGFTTCTIYSLEALGQDARYVFNPSNCHFFVMISTLCIEAIIYVFPAGLHCSCISHLANNLKFCTWQDIWLNLKLPAISYRSCRWWWNGMETSGTFLL